MPQSDFISYLVRKGALRNAQELDAGMAARRRDSLGDIDWLGMTKLTHTSFADELATFYRCGRVQRADLVGGQFAGERLSPRFLKEERLFPYEDRSGALTLAIARPIEDETIRAAEIALQRDVTIAVATADDIDAALATTLETAATKEPTATDATTAAIDDNLDDLRDLARGAPVVRALDELLRLAVEQRGTDLHIEPLDNVLQVRVRIDGLLKPVSAPPMSMAKGLLSRLKIMAGLNITERRLPQDGRARIVIGGAEVILRNALQAPFGMIIVTGPTGSGKTTTLAASLAVINEPARKILTIEDPIEYHIKGINQTQVHPAIGLTFATALRSFLRQDPDVIMVGEMRDPETAHIGVHAALTGHLVLTTLHTNTAAGAIPRLIDLEVESFLLASCVRAIVGQRLIRMLCEHCKKPHRLSGSDLTRDQRYATLGFKAGDTIHNATGCEWCSFTGFHGRRGVFEVIEVTPRLRQAIGPKTDAVEIEKVALAEGMTTMADDGVAKCRAGLTTIDEVFRVTASLKGGGMPQY